MKFIRKNRVPVSASAGTARLSFLKEQSIKTVFFFTAFFAVIVVSFILLFLLRDGYPIFAQVGILNFLLGPDWAPTAVVPLYGIFPLIVGTLLVTIGAMVFAVPLSLGCAIYISELASPRAKKILKPAVELLAGIPSVVYGFFGLIVLTSFIRVVSTSLPGRPGLRPRCCSGLWPFPRSSVSLRMPSVRYPTSTRKGRLRSGQPAGRQSAGCWCPLPCRALLLPSSSASAVLSERPWQS